MARPNLIRQIYGYLVCLIAIITLLIAVSSLIGAIFDLNRPATMTEMYGPSQTFEEYRAQRLSMENARQPNANGPATSTTNNAATSTPTDSALRHDYDESRAMRRAEMHWNAMKSIVTSIIMIVVALVLFTIHWRWLRGLERIED